jgi:hypothetical protein
MRICRARRHNKFVSSEMNRRASKAIRLVTARSSRKAVVGLQRKHSQIAEKKE